MRAAVAWLPVLVWTVINWTVITNPNPNPSTNSKPNTNPNSDHNKNSHPNLVLAVQLLTVQISSVQISPGNFIVHMLTVQISSGYPIVLPLFRSQFVTGIPLNVMMGPQGYRMFLFSI